VIFLTIQQSKPSEDVEIHNYIQNMRIEFVIDDTWVYLLMRKDTFVYCCLLTSW